MRTDRCLRTHGSDGPAADREADPDATRPVHTVAGIVGELARRVIVGEYRPGGPMASTRQVADEFGVNKTTGQQILVRLQAMGFIERRHGTRFTVRDVHRLGGVDVYRHMFRHSASAPDSGPAMFGDVIATVHRILLRALLDYAPAPSSHISTRLRDHVRTVELLAQHDTPDHRAIVECEIAIVRLLLTSLGRTADRAIINSIGDMLLDVPAAVDALFAADAGLHALAWHGLAALWNSESTPTQSHRTLIVELGTGYYRRVITRFEQQLLTVTGTSDPEHHAA